MHGEGDLLTSLMPFIVSIGITLFIIFVFALLINKFYVKVDQGKALIVNTLKKDPIVSFTGKLVLPVIHKKEIMDISQKKIEINRKGKEGLICKDNIRADIDVAFFVRINKTAEAVLQVASRIGCERASTPQTLEELFNAKFSEALKTVGKQLDFEDLYRERALFREKILEQIGTSSNDLDGYELTDVAIDYLEQTPISLLDKENILDAQGIRKITELTAAQNVNTNNLKREEELQIKKKNVESREMILELERQEADAEARQQREIANIQARETAESDRVATEENLKAEQARIQADQEIEVLQQNKQREIEVAEKNRERAVAIETEKVERVRQLETISREKEVELQRIAKEKALEEERKAIADVTRERVAVDRTVAEEEENIKRVRVLSEAERAKDVRVMEAEAEAQESLVKELKAAEAAEQKAVFAAKEMLTIAQAELETSEKEAAAKIRIAEGVKAEQAAPGLAKAEIDEAQAISYEKQGLAQAKVLQEKMRAEALGIEQKGLAEAKASAEKMQAEAQGKEQLGMAEVRVKEADALSQEKQALVDIKVKIAEAEAIEKQGLAEAEAIKERFKAEADGLREKFAAMGEISEVAREHEEFRMKLDTSHAENMSSIAANKEIAHEQAKVLAEALKQANIDIVSGDGQYFDRFASALSVGKAIDGAVDKSVTLQSIATMLSQFMGKSNGDASVNTIDQVSAKDEKA
ncbi:hypothetical protein [Zooshikella ganghwensis]|uniref:hypothetical protein n=1 Tax=Zooshikella ganghwensis TaxID=202772 RepID=UPI0004207703|nr:hypothetical protein [Zooshikella ganghwensis]